MNKSIVTFFSELGMFKRATRLGPKIAGVMSEEYLSSHVVRAAQVAYVLAHLEKADPEKSAAIVLFHDNGELRVSDHNKVAARYVDISESERTAIKEQMEVLPKKLANRILEYYQEYEECSSKEGIIARDADLLEAAVSAKEMVESGYKGMEDWIKNVAKALKTKSAKSILADIRMQKDFTNSWWQGLKKIT
ncbi:MAG: HD domain-containing protein [Patescibacteria group bacterium]